MVKIYFHLNTVEFSNCYVVTNQETREALIVDPGQITENVIAQIEDNDFTLRAILVTHNHADHVNGLATLRKIYRAKVYGADWEVAGEDTIVIRGDGAFNVAGLYVEHISLPGHTADSMAYKIGNVIFTGDAISAGLIGETTSSHTRMLLKRNIEQKLFSQHENTILMPGYGPPSCVSAERTCNIDLDSV